jgi:hypothetical protein
MKSALFALLAVSCLSSTALADECRRVTRPTTIAVVAHGGVWTRAAELGMTFRARDCKTRINGNLYCRLHPYEKPDVYVRHADEQGNEYTAFWGNRCK